LRTKKTSKMKLPSVQVIGIIGLAIAISGLLAGARPAAQEEDMETCAECHDELAKIFTTNPHAAIGASSCTDCHGSAETHLEEGGGANIFSFKDEELPTEKSKKCLSCHSRTNSRFMASSHGKSALDCSTCHVIHAETTRPSLLETSAVKSCFSCHQDVYSQFQLNERHRLQEGIMGCTTCHNPHEPATRERLAGFNHQACLECHTDKSGPFLYEHGASRIEGCSSCHDVHGSPNRHMLTHQSTSDLCFSCHTAAPDWHSRFGSTTTNCTVCHATIHGSNLNRLFLK